MRHRRPKQRSMLPAIVAILLLIIVGGGAFFYIQGENQYKADLTAYSGREKNTLVNITIPENSNIKTIAALLKEKDLIPSDTSFLRYAKESGDDSKLQAGKFSLRSNLSMTEVADVLTGRAVSEEIRLTIPEGYTIREIAGLLVSKGLISTEEELLDCISRTCDFSDVDFLPSKTSADLAFPYSYMEGYLFPDTYFVHKDSFSPNQFVHTLLATFESKALPLLPTSKAKREETVILASILEKESRPRDNQPLVAGILWNRINNGIQLATDATNRYIMDDPLGEITYQSLTSNDPYNLRRVKGLPPSAISNPGLASIKAILNPEDSDYFYYLHDSTGQIYFSKTEAEHNRKKNQYLQ